MRYSPSLSIIHSWSYVSFHLTSIDVAGEQGEDDEEMSTKQRLILVSGSVVGGASEMVDSEILSSTMNVTGT